MKIMLFFLPFLLFFQACKKESQPNGSPEMGSLLLIDSLRLPLDPSCSASSAGMVYFEENGKEWLYFFNEKKSDIRVFDLQTERQTDIIPIHRSGPDYIPPGFLGFHPWSSDSILVPAFNNTLYLIDREGKVLQKIDYGQLQTNRPITPAYAVSRYGATAIRGQGSLLYALQLDGIFTYQNGNKGIDQYHLCYKFDLASKTAKLMPVHFPRELWENGIIELNTSWTFNGDRWVFAPVHSNQIFATPDLNAFNAVYSSSSRHMAPFQGYDPNETASKPWKEYAVDFLSHGEFTGFAFDPWRGCYYRFFFPGMKNAQDLAQPEKAIQDPPLLGLLVLNEAFETVLDTLLPERTYSHHHFFIGKKGLYLAVNHPEYPNLKEDTLAFHVLSLRNGGN